MGEGFATRSKSIFDPESFPVVGPTYDDALGEAKMIVEEMITVADERDR